MAQPSAKYVFEKSTPASYAQAITPSDVTTYLPTRGISFEVAGDLEVTMAGDSDTVVIPGLAAGVIHPLSVTQIQTGTAATGIVAYW